MTNGRLIHTQTSGPGRKSVFQIGFLSNILLLSLGGVLNHNFSAYIEKQSPVNACVLCVLFCRGLFSSNYSETHYREDGRVVTRNAMVRGLTVRTVLHVNKYINCPKKKLSIIFIVICRHRLLPVKYKIF